MTDSLGVIFGPLLALGLVAWLGVQSAIGLSAIPGLPAAAAIVQRSGGPNSPPPGVIWR
ncbi:hypothetical protein AB0D04_03990 [Streptomyces sp. NPDC048483]|uniref:hypothetical protein n=1 Tax=Streptomyces sp. NPDC048483 TaxID=3154927 RepID=UPI003417EAC9